MITAMAIAINMALGDEEGAWPLLPGVSLHQVEDRPGFKGSVDLHIYLRQH
ncbi:MAG: hypothetical protein ACI9DC_003263, partial [Gammaproteobacteria bacterium]